MMNPKTVIAAAALAAASLSAIAADASTGALTRAEVKAELRDLQAAGLVPSNQEASATPLDDQRRNRMFSQHEGGDRVARAVAERDGLMPLADRADEAPVIIIERVPQNDAAPAGNSGALPYDHPAVRDGSPSDEAPQVPAQ
jgi:hypothetical protein